jgi:predicted MPP superfamily phosphohydrolase
MRSGGSKQQDALIHCDACGGDVPEVYVFCPACGARLQMSRPIASGAQLDATEEPRKPSFILRALLVVVALICLITAYAFFIEPNNAVEERVVIRVPGLPKRLDGFKIAHLSDIHVTSVGRCERQAIDIVNRANVDVVVVSGDLAGGIYGGRDEISDRACLAMLEAMKTRYGVYASLGSWDLGPLVDKLNSAGVRMLLDASRTFTVRGQAVTVAGVRHDTQDLDKALMRAPEGAFRIAISEHMDNRLRRSLVRRHVTLCLTGARHGGQVRIPLLCRFYGREYRIGLERVGPRTWHYANRGLGTTKFAARFLCSPEVSVITLKRA